MSAKIRTFAVLGVFLVPAVAWAQIPGVDLEGVFLDGDRVLKNRTTDPDPRLKELRKQAKSHKKEGGLCYISLPRLLAEARKHVEAGEKLPDHIRFLGGMVKLQYIFVFPGEKDLVIAGPAEPFDPTVEYRPLGKITGRPVLQLDDLVTALRSAGPGKKPDRIGVDILITKEIAERVNEKVKELGPKIRDIDPKEATRQIAAAGGEQPVRFYGVDPDTRFAFVCVVADYRLKQLGLNLLKSPVRKVRSYFGRLSRPEPHHRFSLESHYESILVSEDGHAFEFRGPSLMIDTGLLRVDGTTFKGGKISKAAQKFKDDCNKNFDALTETLLSWADLANLGDLTVLATLIGKDGLHEKTGWDLSWAMNSYPVAKMTSPKSAEVICNYRYAGGMILFTSGGVGLFPTQWAGKLTKTEAVGARAIRPDRPVLIPTRQGK